jgi:hypothetical protein
MMKAVAVDRVRAGCGPNCLLAFLVIALLADLENNWLKVHAFQRFVHSINSSQMAS